MNNFSNLKHTLSGTILHRIVCKFNLIPSEVVYNGRIVSHCDVIEMFHKGIDLRTIFGESLPNLFGGLLFGWIYYIIVSLIIILLIYINREGILMLVKGLIPSKKYNISFQRINKIVPLLLFILFYTLFYIFSGYNDVNHIIMIMPYVFIILGVYITALYKSKKKPVKYLALSIKRDKKVVCFL